MKKRFTEEQIIQILKEQEAGERTIDVCLHHEISQLTFYKRKTRFGGMEISDARKLKSLKAENTRLKKLLPEHMLHNATLKEVNSIKTVESAAKPDTKIFLQDPIDDQLHDRKTPDPETSPELLA